MRAAAQPTPRDRRPADRPTPATAGIGPGRCGPLLGERLALGIVTRTVLAEHRRTDREIHVATLLVANAGGHLQELFELFPRLDLVDHAGPTWVTFDTAQARSLLRGADVVYVPYPRPRDLVVTTRHVAYAWRLLGGRRRFSHAISTGSSIALPFLAGARLAGRPAITSRVPRAAPVPRSPAAFSRACRAFICTRKSRRGTTRRGTTREAVFDAYEPVAGPRRPVRKVAVAAGSSESYGFRRLLEATLRALPEGAEVSWQTGSTPVDGLPIEARPAVPSEQLAAEFSAADVVITHAGVGLSLLALSAGRCPVLVPRSAARGEHVDDHQHEVAAELDRRRLAVACEADELSFEVLERAAALSATRVASPPVFHLAATSRRR